MPTRANRPPPYCSRPRLQCGCSMPIALGRARCYIWGCLGARKCLSATKRWSWTIRSGEEGGRKERREEAKCWSCVALSVLRFCQLAAQSKHESRWVSLVEGRKLNKFPTNKEEESISNKRNGPSQRESLCEAGKKQRFFLTREEEQRAKSQLRKVHFFLPIRFSHTKAQSLKRKKPAHRQSKPQNNTLEAAFFLWWPPFTWSINGTDLATIDGNHLSDGHTAAESV